MSCFFRFGGANRNALKAAEHLQVPRVPGKPNRQKVISPPSSPGRTQSLIKELESTCSCSQTLTKLCASSGASWTFATRFTICFLVSRRPVDVLAVFERCGQFGLALCATLFSTRVVNVKESLETPWRPTEFYDISLQQKRRVRIVWWREGI